MTRETVEGDKLGETSTFFKLLTMTESTQIKLFTAAVFASIIAIAAAYHWIVQISYEKPRKSPITPELRRKFHPMLFEPEPNFIKQFLTKLNIL